MTAVVWAPPLSPPRGGPPFGSTRVLLLDLVKRENFELAGTSSVGSACATGTETSALNLGSPEVQRKEGEQRTYGPRLGIMQCRGPNRRTLPLLGIPAHGTWAGERFPWRALAEKAVWCEPVSAD